MTHMNPHANQQHHLLAAASDLSRWTFLCGSGVSVPSGLPSGWEFNTGLVNFLCDDPTDAKDLLSMVTAGYGAGGETVRFEEVLNVLRERGDRALEVLRCFDTPGPATELHHFLAHAASAGSHVITTNFDSLVELAFSETGTELPQVYAEARVPNSSMWMSFAEYAANGLPTPAILKLHGTLRTTDQGRKGGTEQFWSVGATLDRLGQASTALKLEPSKDEVLRRALQGRFLCVMGYSGNDDFDVTPSLSDTLEDCSGLIWIAHENKAPRTEAWTLNQPGVVPEGLHGSLARVPVLYASGHTADAVRQIFGHFPFSAPPAPVARISVGDKLTEFPTYRSIGPGQKKIIAARIAEKASRLDYARTAYQKAIALVRRHDPASATYALFRIAHIETLRGNVSGAVPLLRSARASAGFRRDPNNRVHVLNATGNIHLQRGQLGRARRYYTMALAAATQLRNPRLEAVMLNNLGLIEKKRGDYASAVALYDRAFELDREARERIGMARDLSNKAAALLLMGRHADALPVFDEVIELQRLLGRSELLAVSVANRAGLYRRMGRLAEAQAEAIRALGIERGLGRQDGIARCLSVLASIASDRSRWDRAIGLFRKAISIEEAVGAREALAFDYESIGDCYAAVGDRHSAATAYERSRELFAALGNRAKSAEMRKAARAQLTLAKP
jgi:tetratricopeptide (TPR) repeat protein/NAD-dependent SIR2 family protein deacetylase